MTLKSKKNIVILTMFFIIIFNLKAQSQADESLTVFYDWNTAMAGYKNTVGQIIIPAKFDYADKFSNGLAVVSQGGKYGYIDKLGNQILSIQFEEANDFKEGYTIVKINSEWVLINIKGQKLKTLDYEDITQFDTLYLVKKFDYKEGKKLYGYLNYKGGEIIKPQIEQYFFFQNGLSNFGYYKDGNLYMNTRLQVALYLKCDTKAGDFSEELAAIVVDGKVGFINTKGQLAIPTEYDYNKDNSFVILPSFYQGLACVQKNGKYGYVNKQGVLTIPCKYEYASNFSKSGIATVTVNKKEGAIDINGNWVIQPVYKSLDAFFLDDVARAELDGKYGFVDKSGKVVVPFTYELVYGYNQGAPFGKRNGKWALLNKEGKPVTPFQFEEVYGDFSEGLACVKLNGKYGYISKSGKVIIDYKFDSGQSFEKGVVSMYKSGSKTIYDKRGRVIFL